ncbi:LuxR C-terminal-related transcriptional regulator [Prauserella flavalba]|uniref:LuxR C-terminal-related transcriptional regulator n=1 Tax=Prauserella flavalba TaxID=1477506 RepID=UPI0036ECAA01
MGPDGHNGRPRPRYLSRAKTAVPQLPAGFVARPALRELLGRAAVTSVCAPAGYGKTLLLADWVRAGNERRTAWVRLDAGDNDPERFWSSVLTALARCAAVPANSALRRPVPPGGDPASFVAEVVNALDELAEPVWLVLDDVQELTAVSTLHALATLVRHQPPALNLVFAGRSELPLPLPRLRVEGRLTDLTAAELRFSAEEADTLLRSAGVALDAGELAGLVEQTGGWVAGLRLAARSLPAAPDREAFLACFAGEDTAVADYLGDEVLGTLTDDVREFLSAISVCDTVTPPLAGVLSGRADAGLLLDELSGRRALVTAARARQQSYRVHPLLREHLRAGLRRQRPQRAVALHTAAAHWYASHARPREAIDHAGRAEDTGVVSELLREEAVGLLLRGDRRAVLDGLAAAGQGRVRADAWLSLVAALADVEAGDPASAEPALADSEAAWPEHAGAELESLRSLVLATYALVCGRAPGEAEPGGSPATRPWAALLSGCGLLHDGDLAGARRGLTEALRTARERDLGYLAMHCHTALGAVSALEGDYADMAGSCAAAVAIAAEHGRDDSPLLAPARLLLGFAALLGADARAALRHAAEAAGAAGELPQARLRFLIDVLTGAALTDRGRHADGLRLLHDARAELGEVTLLPQPAVLAALMEYRAALRVGREAHARDVRTWLLARVTAPAERALFGAWWQAAHGEPAAARRMAEAVAEGDRGVLGDLTRVEARLLETALALRARERTRARRCLASALTLAEPSGLILPFAHAEPTVRQLLADQLGGFGSAGPFAERVHRALAEREGVHAEGLLTGREHVVLARLGSHQSLSEVASGLSVSVNTVKTHVRAIYGKLGVNNRRAAVVAARELGLT